MEVEMNISKCGSYCHKCPACVGNTGTEEDRIKGNQAWERYFGLHFKPEVIKCAGCQAAEPWKTGNLLPSRMCSIRSCALFNEVETCAHCAEFPCKEYVRLCPGDDLRERQEKARGIKFSGPEYLQNIEPFEGAIHLTALRKTLGSNQVKSPKPFTTGENIVPFPSEPTLDQAQSRDMESLHRLLSSVINRSAPTYIEQIVLNRHLPCALALIWSLSYYGRADGERLILSSKFCKDKKECTRFVRKTDNQLHGLVRNAVARLADNGLVITFTPLKKEWEMALEVSLKDGDSSTLKSLKRYVNSLASRFGEPVYAGSYNLKGRAFKLFSNVDMRGM
jgi:hypothetical protein